MDTDNCREAAAGCTQSRGQLFWQICLDVFCLLNSAGCSLQLISTTASANRPPQKSAPEARALLSHSASICALGNIDGVGLLPQEYFPKQVRDNNLHSFCFPPLSPPRTQRSASGSEFLLTLPKSRFLEGNKPYSKMCQFAACRTRACRL